MVHGGTRWYKVVQGGAVRDGTRWCNQYAQRTKIQRPYDFRGFEKNLVTESFKKIKVKYCSVVLRIRRLGYILQYI